MHTKCMVFGQLVQVTFQSHNNKMSTRFHATTASNNNSDGNNNNNDLTWKDLKIMNMIILNHTLKHM